MRAVQRRRDQTGLMNYGGTNTLYTNVIVFAGNTRVRLIYYNILARDTLIVMARNDRARRDQH